MILSELNEIIVRVAKSNFLVNEAFAGDVYEVNAKENKFGCFVATPMTAIRNNSGSITYHYTMYYIDRLTKDEKNLDFVQSDAVTMLKSLINYFDVEEGFELETEYHFTLFRHQFDDWCAGAFVELDITVPDLDCEDYDYGVIVDLRPITITRNGKFVPQGFDGFSEVLVDVEGGGPSMEEIDEEIDRKLVGYATEEWVEEQGYLTEHQKLKTINGESIIGEGNIVIQGGGVTPEDVEEIVDGKLEGYVKIHNYDGAGREVLSIEKSGTGGSPKIMVKRSTSDNYFERVEIFPSEIIITDRRGSSEYYSTTNAGSFRIHSANISLTIDQYSIKKSELIEGSWQQTLNINYGNIATKSWVEEQGYLTEHQDLSDYALKSEIPSLEGYATETWVEGKGYLTEHQSLVNYLDKTFTGVNTLSGKLQVGDATTNVNNAYLHIRNVGTATLTGSKVNGACFAVNSDGTTGFFHKSYNDDGSGAKNDAILRFSSNGIQFAKKPGGNVAESDYKDVAMKEDIPSVWTGTQAEWDLLTDEQKSSYTIALIKE